MFKTALNIDFVFEAVILIVCGIAWAFADFPGFMEVATLGGLGLVCFGIYYLGITWHSKNR